MVNELLQKQVLQLICKNTSIDSDLASVFVKLEQMLFRNKVQNGSVLHFACPYHQDFFLDVSIRDGKLEIVLTDGAEVIKMQRNHDSFAKLYERGQKIASILDKKHITLAPLPDSAFIDAIVTAEKGSVINFNNQLGIVCLNTNDGKKAFKRQFQGNLFDIKIESFTTTDTYIIDTNNIQDLHYLYGKAFSSLTNTVTLRISKKYMGQHICTDIEKVLPKGSTKKIRVGPISLSVLKAHDGAIAWYDGTGKKVQRDTVGAIFGWAENTIPEASIRNWRTMDVSDGLEPFSDDKYDEILHSIKMCANEQRFDLLIEEAFRVASRDGISSLSIDDFERNENGDYLPITYAFKIDDSGRHIYKFSYKDANLYDWPISKQEVSKEDFILFCEKKFDETCKCFINKNELTVSRLMATGKSRAQASEAILEMIKSRTGTENFLGITKEDINAITDKVLFLLDDMDNLSDNISAEEFVNTRNKSL